MFEQIGDHRRAHLDRKDPIQLRASITHALGELQGYSRLHESMGAQPINPIDKLLLEIGDAALDLSKLGEEPPTADLTGVCDEFLYALPDHPVWNRIAELRSQQELKVKLLAKWERFEQWQRKHPETRRRLIPAPSSEH